MRGKKKKKKGQEGSISSVRLQNDVQAARKIKMMKDRLTNSQSIVPRSWLVKLCQERIHSIKIKE